MSIKKPKSKSEVKIEKFYNEFCIPKVQAVDLGEDGEAYDWALEIVEELRSEWEAKRFTPKQVERLTEWVYDGLS